MSTKLKTVFSLTDLTMYDTFMYVSDISVDCSGPTMSDTGGMRVPLGTSRISVLLLLTSFHCWTLLPRSTMKNRGIEKNES